MGFDGVMEINNPKKDWAILMPKKTWGGGGGGQFIVYRPKSTKLGTHVAYHVNYKNALSDL